jgi:peroxiredoxin
MQNKMSAARDPETLDCRTANEPTPRRGAVPCDHSTAGRGRSASLRSTRWMSIVLLAAAAYNVLWGASVVLAPAAWFQLAGMEPPRYVELWQCIGMIVGVYGVGYAVAAASPLRHWPIVLVGFLGKLLGPIGFVVAAVSGNLPWTVGWLILTNDLIWWIPFAVILKRALWFRPAEASAPRQRRLNELASKLSRHVRSDRGRTLEALSQDRPLMIVFLRHLNCAFCREALSDVAAQQHEIRRQGVGLVFVHMGPEDKARELMEFYGVGDVDHFCDSQRRLYRAFGVRRGDLVQVLGPQSLWRGIRTIIVDRHGVGAPLGDEFQMPGIVVLHNRRVKLRFRHRTVADRPDYAALVAQAVALDENAASGKSSPIASGLAEARK